MTSVYNTVPLAPSTLFINLISNARVSAAKVTPYQVFISQNYPYLQKNSVVLVTEIATLKRVFFVKPLGEGAWMVG